MKVIKPSVLRVFWESHAEAEQPLRAWLATVEDAEWKNPVEITNTFTAASILKAGRVVFNIHGGSYRLVVWVKFEIGLVLIKFIGTHTQYDEIDAQTVGLPPRRENK